MKKISILVVAPYPEFGELAVDIAKAYPQINVYVAPGIYQNAIDIPKYIPAKNSIVLFHDHSRRTCCVRRL